MSCTRCHKSHSTVQAFLLTCHDCHGKWHHRCHMPPVTDQELVLRIKAHNTNDTANGLQAWRCRRCTRDSTASTRGTPALRASVESSYQPQAQPVSRSSSLRGLPSSESHRTTPLLPSTSQVSASPSIREGSGPATTIHDRNQEEDSSSFASQSLPQSLECSTRPGDHGDRGVVVVDDPDLDSSQLPPPRSVKAKTTESSRIPTAVPTRGHAVARAIKSTSVTSKAARHPLAQEEEESSDSSRRPPLPTRRHLHRTSTQPVEPPSTQRPIRVVTGNNDLISHHPSTPRRKLADESLSQQEKESKREQFKRSVAEKEKRKRLEHKQRQQLSQARVEEKQSVEAITSEVIDLTLDITPQSSIRASPKEPTAVLLDHSTPEITTQAEGPSATSPTPPVIPLTSSAAEKEAVKEPDLAPQWIQARTDDNDIWARALRKKASEPPRKATGRKFKAQKLGEVRPELYQFNAVQWAAALRRGRL
ncbi:hypothetical protein P691DRAFT_521650 [Macrolepiota fuliginosa MF-IS2]|uniref:PHD-type domain-containing protein n=1 Tax=Macrolepiota fuliginosa MF-IS2 TaxID=1400762 RepID=A0A9P6C6D2_9AGAR|nr:hypothetical protein P691DRAFT_521650 [Macrolepiota fuliginosa MF-IS2]